MKPEGKGKVKVTELNVDAGTMEAESRLEGLSLVKDKVCIRPKVTTEKGGLIMPMQAQEEVMFGEVLAVGGGAWQLARIEGGLVYHEEIPMMVRPGMRVVHDKYGGMPIEYKGEKLILARQPEIFGHFRDGWDVRSVEMFGRFVMIDWEFATKTFSGTDIIIPSVMAERYFTGVVISAGPLTHDLRSGMRVFWDQFCRPHKIEDFDAGKRYAIILDDDIYCEVPLREEAPTAIEVAHGD